MLIQIRKIGALISFFILHIYTSWGATHNEPDYKSILLLFALQPATPAYSEILTGIRTKLDEEIGPGYNMYIEYLDKDRLPQWSFAQENFDPLNEKYKDLKLDLLICIGIDLVHALKQYGSNYLLDLPTVSLDLDLSNYGLSWDKYLNKNTVSIPLTLNAGKTISTIFEMMPGTKSIYFICGISYGDQVFQTVARKEARHIKSGVKVNFMVGERMDNVLRAVRDLPDNSVIIVPRYTNDSSQVYYYNTQSVGLISRAAGVPVFTFTSMGFGEGAVGGYILSFNRAGLIAGDAAVRLLRGADPGSIKYTEEDYYEYIFDWHELQRWHMTGSGRIPKESTIVFREEAFIDKYRWIILVGISFLIIETMLIARLIMLYRKQKLMTLQIRESENKFRELVRQDRILRIGQMSASISHELNQPLTAILSNAQAGVRFIDSKNFDLELLKHIFHNIIEDDKRAAEVLRSIRGMMKFEKRKKQKENLNKLIYEAVDIFRGEAIGRHVRINVNIPEDDIFVIADGIQIQQVLLNFASNAMHSVDTAKPDNRRINISLSYDSDNVTISVRDFGAGIDDAIKEKIFKPFITSKEEGLGIGLSISHAIIQEHGGKISAENKPDGGAEFSFSLKIHKNAG